MKLEGLKQAPFNTTKLGALAGAADYLGRSVPPPDLYGATGHAFVINIHKQLCPSGPYCWPDDGYARLLENLGLRQRDLGFFHSGSDAAARAGVEQQVRDALDAGLPCSLLNMENQLITGYDETGFDTAQPWPGHDFPPARLTYGTWQEWGPEVHVNFYVLSAGEPAAWRQAVVDSLDYAVGMHRNPPDNEDYGLGPNAYANWIAAVPEHGGGHGNWWNATVWSECRAMAAAYVTGIGARFRETAALTGELAAVYQSVSESLAKVSDRELAVEPKIELLQSAARAEAAAAEQAAALATALR